MSTGQSSQSQFYLDQLAPLVEGVIVGVVRTGEDEFGDEFFGISVKGKDGKVKHLMLLADDEGNAPGSFEIVEGADNG